MLRAGFESVSFRVLVSLDAAFTVTRPVLILFYFCVLFLSSPPMFTCWRMGLTSGETMSVLNLSVEYNIFLL